MLKAMSSILKKKRQPPAVNIVPLVDVLIILLFFFVFIARLPSQEKKTLNITLPKMQTAGTNALGQELVIGIDAQGQFYLDQQNVSKEELLAGIYLAAELQKDRPVLIVADAHSQLEALTFAMDECRKQGLDKVRLQTR